MFAPSIAASLPKPGWLAQTDKLRLHRRLEGAPLRQARADAMQLRIDPQEGAGFASVRAGEALVPLRPKGASHGVEARLARGAGFALRRLG